MSAPSSLRRWSCRRVLELGHADPPHVVERQLEEALAELAEERGIAGGEEAVLALAPPFVLPSARLERGRDLARGLLGREDERHVAAEHALKHGPDQGVVRAAEDDRVAAGLLERR